jgi:hypothetical protein
MVNIATDAPERAAGAARAGRKTAIDPASDIARRVMNEAGRRLLGVAVDRAVSVIGGVADRLQNVAENDDTSLREVLTGSPARTRSAGKGRGDATDEPPKPSRLGAAFSLVMYRAVQALQFLQRLALQVLEALRRLARRPRPAADADTDAEEGPEERAAAEEEDEPGERRGRSPDRRSSPSRETAEPRSKPRRPAAAEPAPRRDRRPSESRTDRPASRERPNRARTR